jgi:hypothetical protein
MSKQTKNVSTSANNTINNTKTNKKGETTMKQTTKLTSNQRQDNVIDVINEMNKRNNLNLGIAEIEFPDGSIEKYYYNGEEDRQAAVDFAQICLDACNSDTPKAKQLMRICFMLMSKGINPTEIVELNDGKEYYIDHKQRILVDGSGNIVVALTDEEKKQVGNSKGAISLILKERANRLFEDDCDDYDDDEDEEEEYAVYHDIVVELGKLDKNVDNMLRKLNGIVERF